MASRSPIFPMPEAQHYSDYGFDPQIDYFQVLEEARRHGKRLAATAGEARSPDSLHFRLRKPISKDDRAAKSKKRRKWWKAALLFWKRDAAADESVAPAVSSVYHPRRASAVSGPVYMTESYGSGSSTPCRSSNSRQGSGPLWPAGGPYLSLREFNVMEEEEGGGGRRASASSPPLMPIYLVT